MEIRIDARCFLVIKLCLRCGCKTVCNIDHSTVRSWAIKSVPFTRDRGSTVVKVLCYKSEGRWFDPSWYQWIFHWRNPSDRKMAMGSTHSVTEMSTRSISWGWRRPVPKADNLPPSCAVVTKSRNLNLLEPSGPIQACNGTALPLCASVYVHGTTEPSLDRSTWDFISGKFKKKSVNKR